MLAIYSKFKLAGGSERRCLELANGIAVHLGKDVQILCRESSFPPQLKKDLGPRVGLVLDCHKRPESFYNSDQILTVNTDSRDFTSLAYWQSFLDMEKMRGKTMVFLFNFIISPARTLCEFEKYDIRLGIITTNKRFFDEVSSKDKHNPVRRYPRMILESPIDQEKLPISLNRDNSVFNVNFLSKAYDDKWNDDILPLVRNLSALSSDKRKFRFNMMGVKHSLRSQLSEIPNVNVYGENQIPMRDFFSDADLFVFYPSYQRQEPWARVIGEAMMCGLPIIALDNAGGTAQQVLDGNNGFLCKTMQDFVDKTVYLFANSGLAKQMGRNSRIYAMEFTSENICKKLSRFMNGITAR